MLVIGLGLGIAGAVLIGVSIFFSVTDGESGTSSRPNIRYASGSQNDDSDESVVANRRTLPTLTPTPLPTETPTSTPSPTVTLTPTATPTDVPASATPDNTVTPTVTQTDSQTSDVESTPTATSENLANIESEKETETTVQYTESYTSTDQVQPPPSAGADSETTSVCPPSSDANFDLIPIEGQPLADHPDYLHADLNLLLRGYSAVSETLALEFYNGNTDPNAPKLHGLFEPNRVPQFTSVHQINEWIWDTSKCNGDSRGCRGEPVDVFWPVTLVGMATTPGEPIYIPERGPQIYSGGFIGMVLYAEKHRITLAYTRRDNVAAGYTVHIENVCVDSNLLGLYQSQKNTDGWHTSGFLPALRNNQSIGVARDNEIRVAIRDVGSFMDPRSEKDWWKQ